MKKQFLLFVYLFLPFFMYSQASLNSITPSGAHPRKVLDVTITGTNTHFSTDNGTIVKFGFNQGSATTAVNKTTIVNQSTIIANITVPTVMYGNYDVTVDNSVDGSLTLPISFNVFPQPEPSLVSVSPSNTLAGKTVSVVVRGHNTNFTSALELSSYIDFRSIGNSNNVELADSISVVDDTTMKVDFTFPTTAFTGDYNLNVTNSIDGTIYLIKGMHVTGLPSPTFVSISPANETAGQTLSVTITGANSHFKQGKDTKVIFGFEQATGTTIVNSEIIANDSLIYANITIPADQAEGDYNVYVDDSIDGTITLFNGFYVKGVPTPALLSISPSIVNAGQTLDVTIIGANTHFQQSGNIEVSFDFNPVSGTTVVNSITVIDTLTLKVNITVPANTYTADYPVGVSNAIDGPLFLYSALHVAGVPPPKLISISPSTAEVGEALMVTITGAHTHFSSTNGTAIDFSPSINIDINSTTVLTDSTMEAHLTVLDNASPGDYSLSVVNTEDGNIVLENSFHVTDKPQPTIVSINPSSGTQVESVVIAIASKNTSFKSGVYTVQLVNSDFNSNDINANSVAIANDTLLNAVFTFNSSNRKGKYDLIVKNSQTNSSIALKKAFNLNEPLVIIPPVLLSSFPASGSQGDTLEITIKSKSTHFTAPLPTYVSLLNLNNEIIPVSLTIINDETIKAKFLLSYFNEIGDYNVVVSNSIDGPISLKQAFTLNRGALPPSLTSIYPNSGNRLGKTMVTIKGKNTFFKRDSVQVTLAKRAQIQPQEINYLNDTTMTALFSFEEAAAGQYDVYVFHPYNEERLILPQAFTLNDTLLPPSVISFDPISASQGDSVKITVKGKNTHFLHGWTNVTLKNNVRGITGYTNILNDSIVEATFLIEYFNTPSKYALEIYNFIDSIFVSTDSFTINKGLNPPKLISVNPSNVTQGQKVDILIKASKSTRISSLRFVKLKNSKNKLYSKTCSSINDSCVLATFELYTGSSQLGVYDIGLYANSNDTLWLPGGLTISKNLSTPSLVSMNPSTATQFDTVLIMVKGSRSHFLSELPDVRMRGTDNSYIESNGSVTAINDTLLKVKFVLNYNYYSSTLYDLIVSSKFDGNLELKKAFTLNKVYYQTPQIINIYPKEAGPGQSIVLNIIGRKKTFLPGVFDVKLFYYTGFTTMYSILPTSVKYINDSLITASFSFSNSVQTRDYYLSVSNKSNLLYSPFYLKQDLVTSKLLTVSPSWASQKDTVELAIAGFGTHFNSTDSVWLESKLGTKIKPFQLSVINDTKTSVKFAFSQSAAPVVYSVYVKNVITKSTLVLNNAFTITGSLNVTSLINVTPKSIACNVTWRQRIEVTGLKTHFLTDADTIIIMNPVYQQVIYPFDMKILNDNAISASFIMNDKCGFIDIMVLGKENCILVGKLNASPQMFIEETPKESFKIFPNPSQGVFTLELNKDFEQADLIVVDVLGKIVFSGKKMESTTQIDLSDHPAGMYFIQLVKDNISKTGKIIKQ